MRFAIDLQNPVPSRHSRSMPRLRKAVEANPRETATPLPHRALTHPGLDRHGPVARGPFAPRRILRLRSAIERTIRRTGNGRFGPGRLAEQAREHPERVFTSLHHLIDIDWRLEAYRRTRKDGATGIDGVTAADY